MAWRVLLIDEDSFRTEGMKSRIHDRWLAEEFEFTEITNEREFQQRFEELANAGFNLIIIDQMIPYTTETDDADYDSARQLSAFRGGTRCHDLLRKDDRTRNVSVVFYTILDNDSVPPGAVHVKKSGDFALTELLEAVGRSLNI